MFQLNSSLVKFLNTFKKIYVGILFLEVHEEAPSYLNFLRELHSKKDMLNHVSMIPI